MVRRGARGVVCRCLCIHAFDIRMTLNLMTLCICQRCITLVTLLLFKIPSCLMCPDFSRICYFQWPTTLRFCVRYCLHVRHITLCSRPWSTYAFQSGSRAFQYEPSTTCPSRTGRSLCWSNMCRANVEQTGANPNLQSLSGSNRDDYIHGICMNLAESVQRLFHVACWPSVCVCVFVCVFVCHDQSCWNVSFDAGIPLPRTCGHSR